ncbi:MAG: MlaD family protein [Porticoccaceae bacterium]
METRAHHIVIGFFTIAVAIAALLFALWLSKTGGDRDSRLYDIIFKESVTGLSIGSQVQYNGIRVGEVTRLDLDRDDPRKVIARIKVPENIPVTEATKARLTIANITGSAVIQLVSGPPDSPRLTARSGKVPSIVATPSPFTKLRSSSEELLANISQLASNANKVLSDENTRNMSNIIADLAATTNAIAGERDAISGTLNELAAASREIHRAMTELSSLVEKLNTGLAAHGDDLANSAKSTLAAMEQLSSTLDGAISSNQGSLDQGIQGFAELGPMLQELRTTIGALGAVSRRLHEDPAQFLMGGEKIREYQP